MDPVDYDSARRVVPAYFGVPRGGSAIKCVRTITRINSSTAPLATLDTASSGTILVLYKGTQMGRPSMLLKTENYNKRKFIQPFSKIRNRCLLFLKKAFVAITSVSLKMKLESRKWTPTSRTYRTRFCG